MKQQNQLPNSLFSSLFLTTTLLFLIIQPIPTVSSSSSSSSQSNVTNNPNNTLDLTYIKSSCGATLYPEVCYNSLSRYASAVKQDPAKLAKAAIALSLSRARRLSSFLSNTSRQADYASDHRAVSALHDCSSNVGDAVDEMRGSLKQMKVIGTSSSGGEEEFRFQMSNVQTWMSAALTDEETCTDGFDDVADGQLKTVVCDRVGDVKKFTSNALALVNSYANSRLIS